MSSIYLDEEGAAVIRVGGQCYQLVGGSPVMPTHTTGDIQESFDTCVDCQDSSGSSSAPTCQDLICAGVQPPGPNPTINNGRYYWVLRTVYANSNCTGAITEYERTVMAGSLIASTYGGWDGCDGSNGFGSFAGAPSGATEQEAFEEFAYPTCGDADTYSWAGTRYVVRTEITEAGYAPGFIDSITHKVVSVSGGYTDGDQGGGVCWVHRGDFASQALAEAALEDFGFPAQ